MASAQFVLGITPSLLSYFGSSVAEAALLGSHRMMLSLFLSTGAPAYYQSRNFKYRDPDRTPYLLPSTMRIQVSKPWMWPVIVLCQYILAGAAAANNIDVVLQMGTRSVLAWGCNSWYMPMFWVLLSAVTYLSRYGATCETVQKRSLVQLVRSEFTPIIAATKSIIYRRQEHSAASAGLQHLASVVAWVQLILGTFMFPSLIFIGFHDTVLILVRFLASALVYRFIVMSELVGLREQD